MEAPNDKSPTCHVAGHLFSSRGDIVVLVYLKATWLMAHLAFNGFILSQENVIEGACNFLSGSSLLYVTTLSKLVAINIYGSRNIMVLVAEEKDFTSSLKSTNTIFISKAHDIKAHGNVSC